MAGARAPHKYVKHLTILPGAFGVGDCPGWSLNRGGARVLGGGALVGRRAIVRTLQAIYALKNTLNVSVMQLTVFAAVAPVKSSSVYVVQ